MSDVIDPPEPVATLAEAKAHLRVDHDDDDALIGLYLNAAHTRALDYCRRAAAPEDGRARAAWRAAELLILGDLYAVRDAADAGTAPAEVRTHPAAAALLNAYRQFGEVE